MTLVRRIAFLAAVPALAACGTPRIVADAPAGAGAARMGPPGMSYLVSAEAAADARLRLGILAADSLEGREAGTDAERRAAAHIARWLADAGVEPGGDVVAGRRTYFQAFPVRTAWLDRDGTALAPDGLAPARLGDDWITFPSAVPDAEGTFDVVFAGYGLSDPSRGHDDYAGLDVEGRVVVAMGGAPAGVDSVSGPAGTLPASALAARLVPALQRGARALLIVAGGDVLDTWEQYSDFGRGTAMSLDNGEPPGTAPLPFAFVHPDYAARMLTAAGAPAGVAADAGAGRPVAPISSAGRVRLGVEVGRAQGESRNVVGVLPGAGAVAGEWVALGSHYDHLGVVDGRIFNGADDDASGTTAVLAVAEALARDRAAGTTDSRRSFAFVFHSAEEKGLYGSEFFTDNPDRSPVGAIDRVVAQINLDMVGREHPDSLYVIGHDRLSTSFARTVERANAALGSGGRPLFTFDASLGAPDHPERLYERSDHYNYARFGVPIVFFTDGMGANWAKGQDRDDYHRDDDDTAAIDFEKLMDVARLTYEIARVTADAPERPLVDRPVEPAGTD